MPNLDLVRTGRQIREGESAILIGLDRQIEARNLHGDVGQRLLLEAVQDNAFEIDLRPGADHLGDDGEIVTVRDFDWNRLTARLRRSELELADGCHCRLVEVGPGALQDLEIANSTVFADLNRQ